MSKYIKLEDALEVWDKTASTYVKSILDLPTIEVSDKADRPQGEMNNYEWIKTLEVSELAEVMYYSQDIYKCWVGNPIEVIEKWLKARRVPCHNEECLNKETAYCYGCWGSVDMRGADKE